MNSYERGDKHKNCPWCGWSPELVDARKLAGSGDEIEGFDEKYPFYMRCDNAMCNVQPITKGADTEEHAVYQWNNMQSAALGGGECECVWNEQEGAFRCSSCDTLLTNEISIEWPSHKVTPITLPNYCKNCGRKVKQ